MPNSPTKSSPSLKLPDPPSSSPEQYININIVKITSNSSREILSLLRLFSSNLFSLYLLTRYSRKYPNFMPSSYTKSWKKKIYTYYLIIIYMPM